MIGKLIKWCESALPLTICKIFLPKEVGVDESPKVALLTSRFSIFYYLLMRHPFDE